MCLHTSTRVPMLVFPIPGGPAPPQNREAEPPGTGLAIPRALTETTLEKKIRGKGRTRFRGSAFRLFLRSPLVVPTAPITAKYDLIDAYVRLSKSRRGSAPDPMR